MAGRHRIEYETEIQPKLSQIEAWCRNGATDKDIAEKLGIGYRTLYEIKNKHPQFAQTLKRTKDIVDDEVENALYEQAISGNTTAQIFWLKNRRPEKWREKQETDVKFSQGDFELNIKNSENENN